MSVFIYLKIIFIKKYGFFRIDKFDILFKTWQLTKAFMNNLFSLYDNSSKYAEFCNFVIRNYIKYFISTDEIRIKTISKIGTYFKRSF